ncbi:uncharacterized protein LOC112170975 [Rosa chinensis]|uniref:uncharacterized protein LOC112170975 n=1 Tax=Rosa chinensis TaxID=74649 RepID=UPI000D090D80|nr:uncharacterized protein LOC112170975 [Rosa chinensis]
MEKLVADLGIQFLHSTPYYAQFNGQAEASNKIIITLLKKMLTENPFLPLEINVQSLRVQDQHHLIGEDYVQAMWQEHEDLSEQRLAALDNLVLEKQRVARAYDKRTRDRNYKEGELIWKAVLPFGEKLTGRCKWTPRWEGPFVIHKILDQGAFQLMNLDGEIHRNPINGRFLKKYYPNVWEFEDLPVTPASMTGGQT